MTSRALRAGIAAVAATVAACASPPRRPDAPFRPGLVRSSSAARPAGGGGSDAGFAEAYRTGDAPPPAGVDGEVFAVLEEALRDEGRGAVAHDPALSVVARRHLANVRSLSFADDRLPWEVSRAGAVDPFPRVMCSYGTASGPGAHVDLAAEARRLLDAQAPRLPDEESYTHGGVGVESAPPRFGVCAVLVDRRVELRPVPSRAEPGTTLSVRGRVLPPLGTPNVYVTTPSGATASAPLRETDARGAGGASFDARVPLREPGVHTIEVFGTDARGPHVLALFPVVAGDAPPPPPAPPADGEADEGEVADAAAAEARVVELVNRERESRGLRPLVADAAIAAVARAHTRAMVEGGFAHVVPGEAGLGERLEKGRVRARGAAENIARDRSLARAHAGLMASPGHRAAILDPRYRRIGVGVVIEDAPEGGRVYWVTEVFVLPAK